ncbi:hypothetical protein AB205_0201400 [Aquarana catesbeiana]|uniref:Uncharacterized protein n=1 Tax=Aquarana catesbeiana TaxID=8400 RepID=A0A2G9S006_AQUCT|nr:hypothetical protein AB205_0201400 [Aquarana catesbeiana]
MEPDWEKVVYDGSTQAECGTFRDIGGKQRESFRQSGKSKPPPGSKIRIADLSHPSGDMDLASEFPGLLRIILSTYTRTVSEDEYLELRQKIRVELWIGALQLAGIKQGKCFPTQEQWAIDQRALRMAFLGERPQEQWVTELDRLVQQEIELDNRYRALQWHAEEGYLGETTECSPEGYDFGGPGLL